MQQREEAEKAGAEKKQMGKLETLVTGEFHIHLKQYRKRVYFHTDWEKKPEYVRCPLRTEVHPTNR